MRERANETAATLGSRFVDIDPTDRPSIEGSDCVGGGIGGIGGPMLPAARRRKLSSAFSSSSSSESESIILGRRADATIFVEALLVLLAVGWVGLGCAFVSMSTPSSPPLTSLLGSLLSIDY
jgi:hypothetical protein